MLENMASALDKAASVVLCVREDEEREGEDGVWREKVLRSFAAAVLKNAARYVPYCGKFFVWCKFCFSCPCLFRENKTAKFSCPCLFRENKTAKF